MHFLEHVYSFFELTPLSLVHLSLWRRTYSHFDLLLRFQPSSHFIVCLIPFTCLESSLSLTNSSLYDALLTLFAPECYRFENPMREGTYWITLFGDTIPSSLPTVFSRLNAFLWLSFRVGDGSIRADSNTRGRLLFLILTKLEIRVELSLTSF